jgi:hypothetical protein
MTESDGAWMARIIARFRVEDLRAAVAAGDFSDPSHPAALIGILLERQRRILRRYLADLSPVGALELRGHELCGIDWARRSSVFDPSRFRYRANAQFPERGPELQPLRVTMSANGGICISLPAPSPLPRDAEYLVLRVANGQAPGELRVFLYDLGKNRGYRLVGIERPEP